MIAIKYCPDCSHSLPDPPFYCNWCGSCLNKTCIKCELVGFSKFCTQCGSEMVRPTVTSKHENNSKTSKSDLSTTLHSKSPETTFKSSKNQNSQASNEVTIKVKLLKGIGMKEIKLEDGGGRRHITMNKTDTLGDVKRKIKESYFCTEKYTSLGSFEKYQASYLDFKKDDLMESNRFETLGKYLKDHGLKPNQGPAFYIYLLEKPRYPTSSTIEKFNTSTRHQQIDTIKTTSKQTTPYIHSFNSSNSKIANVFNTNNDSNEIRNTFLLKNKPQSNELIILDADQTPSKPYEKTNGLSNPNSSKQVDKSPPKDASSLKPVLTQTSSLKSSLNSAATLQNHKKAELNSNNYKTPSKSLNERDITYTKKSGSSALLSTITSAEKINIISNKKSSTESETDSSVSSTSSAVVHKKTVKRSNKEISNIRKETINESSPEKKQKISTTNELVKEKVAITFKKEAIEDSNNQTTLITDNNFESLSLTPNSPVSDHFHDDNLKLNVKTENTVYNGTNHSYSNRKNDYVSNNYQSSNYRGNYHQSNNNRYINTNRSSTNNRHYHNSKYSPSKYQSNSRSRYHTDSKYNR